MTHRKRVLATFAFGPTDRVAYDLMESAVWPELMDFFRRQHGLSEPSQVWDLLDVDCRWVFPAYEGPPGAPPAENLPDGWGGTYSDALYPRPLAQATSVADVEAHPWPDPTWWRPPDFQAARSNWPHHALVFCSGWMPLFCGACNAFGMETALVKMATEPAVFGAFVARQHAFCLDVMRPSLAAARGVCDIAWLGDDYASQDALIMGPERWRRFIKPYLAEQVRLVRDHGLIALLHSCGAIRAIIPDLIDIGVDGLLVFQTSARDMDPESIARDFGGRIAFYGGIDCQQLLTFGTENDVRAEVARNMRAFSKCGGYIVANAHCGIANIRGENIVAMCEAAKASASLR